MTSDCDYDHHYDLLTGTKGIFRDRTLMLRRPSGASTIIIIARTVQNKVSFHLRLAWAYGNTASMVLITSTNIHFDSLHLFRYTFSLTSAVAALQAFTQFSLTPPVQSQTRAV